MNERKKKKKCTQKPFPHVKPKKKKKKKNFLIASLLFIHLNIDSTTIDNRNITIWD